MNAQETVPGYHEKVPGQSKQTCAETLQAALQEHGFHEVHVRKFDSRDQLEIKDLTGLQIFDDGFVHVISLDYTRRDDGWKYTETTLKAVVGGMLYEAMQKQR